MGRPVVGIEATDLAALQRDLKRADADSLKLFRDALKKGGDIVADEARRRTISKRIAATIRVGATNKGVYVRAGGDKAPYAAAFENLGKEGTFRHPVFGHRDRWVAQEANPFLLPSLTDDILEAVIEEFLDALTGEAGFH